MLYVVNGIFGTLALTLDDAPPLGVQGYAACHIALNFPTTLQLRFWPISSIRVHRAIGLRDRPSTPELRGETNSCPGRESSRTVITGFYVLHNGPASRPNK